MRGERVGLRARHSDDVPVLQAELYEDVRTRSRSDSRPWRPVPPESRAAAPEPSDGHDLFSVVELTSQDLAGEAVLWDIDTHNRSAHLGVSLRPAFRGRGLGGDVVRVLCEYGFAVRGMRRLQIDTLADNTAMIRAATGAGFSHEGTLRRSAWAYGAFVDGVVLGMLVEEWGGPQPGPP